MKNDQRVLVTGATNGLGLELARNFARNGHPLILVSVEKQRLEEIAREFEKKHAVEVITIVHNSAQPDAAEQLFCIMAVRGLEIEILVNNSCVGEKNEIRQHPLELHAKRVVNLTRLFLPAMKARGHGRILNLASTGCFMSAHRNAIYHGTKAFVLSYSDALNFELKDSGVTATALCPDATDTNSFPRNLTVDPMGFPSQAVVPQTEIAEGGYHALMMGEKVYAPHRVYSDHGISLRSYFYPFNPSERAAISMREKAEDPEFANHPLSLPSQVSPYHQSTN